MLVFIKNYEAKSRTTGKYYQSVTIAEVKQKEDSVRIVASVKDFFVDVNMDLTYFNFGDQIKCTFEDSEYFGGAPRLVKIVRVKETPFTIAE